MAVTILAIADAVSPVLYDYFEADRWRQVDIVLSAGDLPPEYLDFLCSSLNVPVLYVRGNHDGRYETSRFDGSENIHGRIVTYNGLRIAGFEGCRRYNHGGACQYTEAQMRRTVRRSRIKALRHGPPDIILSHAPASGCHDDTDECHRGFDCFHDAINSWKPSLFVHGHVHAYHRGPTTSQVGNTTVINVFPYRLITVPAAGETGAVHTVGGRMPEKAV